VWGESGKTNPIEKKEEEEKLTLNGLVEMYYGLLKTRAILGRALRVSQRGWEFRRGGDKNKSQRVGGGGNERKDRERNLVTELPFLIGRDYICIRKVKEDRGGGKCARGIGRKF